MNNFFLKISTYRSDITYCVNSNFIFCCYYKRNLFIMLLIDIAGTRGN